LLEARKIRAQLSEEQKRKLQESLDAFIEGVLRVSDEWTKKYNFGYSTQRSVSSELLLWTMTRLVARWLHFQSWSAEQYDKLRKRRVPKPDVAA